MKTQGRLHALVALLLTMAVGACGSQSRANESEDGQDGGPPAAQASATDEREPAVQEEPASGDPAQTEARTSTPTETQRETPARSSETTTRRNTRDADERPATSAREETGAPEPVREEPPAPATATVAAGTTVSLTLDQELSTAANRKGDSFTATVSAPVIEGSRVLIPEGAVVRGTVTALQEARDDKPPMLTVDFESIEVRGESSDLAATLTEADVETNQKMKGKGKKIGGGAAAGGLVGGLLGGDVKGALIGAAVGSAAGTAITLATQEGQAVLPAGTPMKIRVDESLQVRI